MPKNTSFIPTEPTTLSIKQGNEEITSHLLLYASLFVLKRTIPNLSALSQVRIIGDFFKLSFINPEIVHKFMDDRKLHPSRGRLAKALAYMGYTQTAIAIMFGTSSANISYHITKRTIKKAQYINPYFTALEQERDKLYAQNPKKQNPSRSDYPQFDE